MTVKARLEFLVENGIKLIAFISTIAITSFFGLAILALVTSLFKFAILTANN